MTKLYDWSRDPGVRWMNRTDDGLDIEKVDPCEAGTCGHPECGAGTIEEVTVDAVSPSDARHQEVMAVLGEMACLTAEPTSIEEGLDVLRAVRFAEDQLASIRRETVSFLSDVMPRGITEVDGYGPVDVSRSVSYSAWEHDALKKEIARNIAASEEFGGDITLVLSAIDRWIAFTGKPGRYSITALRAVGLQADEYASAKWQPSVRLVKDQRPR